MPLGIEIMARAVMNRSRRGLYAGKTIMFGNKVSEDGENKTRRTWKPNVHWKRVYSLALGKMLRIKMTTAAMRDIDKAGGIDEYLTTTPDHKINSDVGIKWRAEIENARIQLTRRHELWSSGKLENPNDSIDGLYDDAWAQPHSGSSEDAASGREGREPAARVPADRRRLREPKELKDKSIFTEVRVHA